MSPQNHPRNKARVPHPPDLRCGFVGSLNFLRLSLMKGAHAVFSRAAYQEIRGISLVFGEMWDSTALPPI
jgi:hypothetical protein